MSRRALWVCICICIWIYIYFEFQAFLGWFVCFTLRSHSSTKRMLIYVYSYLLSDRFLRKGATYAYLILIQIDGAQKFSRTCMCLELVYVYVLKHKNAQSCFSWHGASSIHVHLVWSPPPPRTLYGGKSPVRMISLIFLGEKFPPDGTGTKIYFTSVLGQLSSLPPMPDPLKNFIFAPRPVQNLAMRVYICFTIVFVKGALPSRHSENSLEGFAAFSTEQILLTSWGRMLGA